jgi:integrase
MPTTDEVRAMIDAADGDFQIYVQVAAVTGARRGELVALEWSAVDWKAGTVSFHQALNDIEVRAQVTEIKTGSKGNRIVMLPPEMLAVLRALHARQRRDALRAGIPGRRWVFSLDCGETPWSLSYVDAGLRRVRRVAGVTARGHDLRHYAAATMLAAGVPPTVVAHRLGHSLAVMAEVYADYLPGQDRGAADVLGSALFG